MNIDFGRLIINDSRPLVFILSGAGLSAESGIPTFRGKDGLWKNLYPSEIASDTALKERPEDVFEFYNFRIGKAAACLPNSAHTAIAQFQQSIKDYCDVVHVTQTWTISTNSQALPRSSICTEIFSHRFAAGVKTLSRGSVFIRKIMSVRSAAHLATRSDRMWFSLAKCRTAWIGLQVI